MVASSFIFGSAVVPAQAVEPMRITQNDPDFCKVVRTAPFIAINVSDDCSAYSEYGITAYYAKLDEAGKPIKTNRTGPARYEKNGLYLQVNSGAMTFEFDKKQTYILAVTNGPDGYENQSEYAVKTEPNSNALLIFEGGEWGTKPHPEFYFALGADGKEENGAAPFEPEAKEPLPADEPAPNVNPGTEQQNPTTTSTTAPSTSISMKPTTSLTMTSPTMPTVTSSESTSSTTPTTTKEKGGASTSAAAGSSKSFLSSLFGPLLALFKAIFGR